MEEMSVALRVKTLMSGAPVCIEADAPVLALLDLMLDRGIRHLPVVDRERRVQGIVSINDLRAASPFVVDGPSGGLSAGEREFLREQSVDEVMSRAPYTIGPEASVREAAECMADRRIGCLPVVDEQGRLEGILSATDLLQALAGTLWAEELRRERATPEI
jgi:acetoin utilization protein AcuB